MKVLKSHLSEASVERKSSSIDKTKRKKDRKRVKEENLNKFPSTCLFLMRLLEFAKKFTSLVEKLSAKIKV